MEYKWDGILDRQEWRTEGTRYQREDYTVHTAMQNRKGRTLESGLKKEWIIEGTGYSRED